MEVKTKIIRCSTVDQTKPRQTRKTMSNQKDNAKPERPCQTRKHAHRHKHKHAHLHKAAVLQLKQKKKKKGKFTCISSNQSTPKRNNILMSV